MDIRQAVSLLWAAVYKKPAVPLQQFKHARRFRNDPQLIAGSYWQAESCGVQIQSPL
jgi:hypothetical protein